MARTRNILIDLRDGGDWSLDLCYAGLRHNGGVLDVPYKVKHREWELVEDGIVQTDWGRERRTLGFTYGTGGLDDADAVFANSPEELAKSRLSRLAYSIEDWIGRGDHIRVWLDERMESYAKYRELGLDKIADLGVVVVAGHDRFWNHSPEFVAALYGGKLEGMLLDNWYERYAELPFKARRIGWSTNFDHYWKRPEKMPEKDIDICFVGYNSHPDRARYVDFIESKFPDLKKHIVLEREPDKFDQFIPRAQMFDLMLRSRICLNLRGAADRGKTLRAYEIPYVGSLMLSQRIDDPGMMGDFESGVHCRYFSDESELEDQIELSLAYPAEREWIAAMGHERAMTTLSVKSRWAEVVKWLEDGRRVQETVR